MIEVVRGRLLERGRLGIFPAAFNPPTTAHVALVEGAANRFSLDQVAFVLPRTLPHKPLPRRDFEQRLGWIDRLTRENGDWIGVSAERGLVAGIVHEFREAVAEAVELFVISGRDAAERFVGWDYGDAPSFEEQLPHFHLLVGGRDGAYEVADEHRGRIHPFDLPGRFADVSATNVREDGNWNVVPASIRKQVRAAMSEVPA